MKKLVTAILCALSMCAIAQPVELIVPHGAGGPADTVARRIQVFLGERGVKVVVVNKAGASSMIGVDYFNKCSKHCLVVSGDTALTAYRDQKENFPRDFFKRAVPVALLGVVSNVLVARKDLGVDTLQPLRSLMELSRVQGLTFGTAGVGTTSHDIAEKMCALAIRCSVLVPYKSVSFALLDLYGGRIDAYAVPTLGMNKDTLSRVAIVAVLSEQRLANLPKVPTATEQGVPLAVNTAYLLFSNGVDSSLDTTLAEVVTTVEFESLMLEMGFNVDRRSARQFWDDRLRTKL